MTEQSAISREYSRLQRRRGRFIVLILALLLILATGAVFLGTSNITLRGLLALWFPGIQAEPITPTQQTIIVTLRLPRIVSALLVGAALGVCGTVMQSTTGNIMASPFTTGISSAAGLGAAIGILFHPFGVGETSTILCAFGLAMINATIVYGITAVKNLGPGGMILVGVALNFLFSSANSLLQYVASEDQLQQIVHWNFGSLTGITWTQILIMASVLLLASILFLRYAWSYNVMSSGGDESAKALGVNAKNVRIFSGLMVTLVAAVTISFVGVIGFVGIVAPHVARLLIGSEHRVLLPASTLIGALLVLIADTIGRTVVQPTIIPVGIVLSVVGAPIFLYLILSQNRRRMV
jgi:iron complex transport system permease protein